MARLADQGWRPWEIAKLDPWLVPNMIWYPKDDKGEYMPMPPESLETEHETVTEQEAHAIKLRVLGLPEWRIEALWEEVQERRKERGRK